MKKPVFLLIVTICVSMITYGIYTLVSRYNAPEVSPTPIVMVTPTPTPAQAS